jgi:hypothetical protein
MKGNLDKNMFQSKLIAEPNKDMVVVEGRNWLIICIYTIHYYI